MRQMREAFLVGILASAMIFAMVPLSIGTAYGADSYSYIERSWDGSSVAEDPKTAVCTPITSDTRELNGWYVVNGEKIEINNRLTVTGTANIILEDSKALYLYDGINVPEGTTLNLYAQNQNTGGFYAYADTNNVAAIGGNQGQSGGEINIHGGVVRGDSYNENKGDDSAGIGGGDGGNGGTLRIYSGRVFAYGANSTYDGGAGIGGGDNGHGGNVYIYDAESVDAKGGHDGAGIGGGDDGNGGHVEIWGGKVIAQGNMGAGIGGGEYGTGGEIGIYGGNVTATGGDYGAGIGGGDEKAGGKVTIRGENTVVTARGGTDAAGIGGGDSGGNGGDVIINSGTVKAYGADYAAGIGSGDADSKVTNGGITKIIGGDVYAEGGKDAAGIGGGEGASAGQIRIEGGKVEAKCRSTGADGGAGIGSGDKDFEYIGGNVDAGFIEITGGEVIATGAEDAAGIGGGNRVSGKEIYISGGKITATGGTDAAGIGGGQDSGGGKIEISGGTITATGGEGGAGIGGGDNFNTDSNRNCGDITIKNVDKLIAQGGELAAGIGGGRHNLSGSITIEKGDIEAKGGESGAGIGSGLVSPTESNASLAVTINGGTVKATGGKSGAGIGGGKEGLSGKVRITGGDITAEGGKDGAAGIGHGSQENHNYRGDEIKTVDVTIDGGTVTAKAGKMSDNHCLPGTAIGTGGGRSALAISKKTPAHFNGSIDLNGGDITAHVASMDASYYCNETKNEFSVIGTGNKDKNLEKGTGNVNFNGAHVIMHASLGSNGNTEPVKASNISLKEDATIHQMVRSSDDGKSWNNADKDKRLDALQMNTYKMTEVLICKHENADYTDKGDNHAVVCKNCNFSNEEEDHVYGDPVWTWEDYSAASAKFTCTKCGHEETVDASITSGTNKGIDEQGRAYKETTYTAKASIGGKEYTDTKKTRDYLPMVTIDIEVGSGHDSLFTEKVLEDLKKEMQAGSATIEGTVIKLNVDTDYTESQMLKKIDAFVESLLGSDDDKDNGECFRQSAYKPIDEYATAEDLDNDIHDETHGSTPVSEGLTYYLLWAKPYTKLELDNGNPTCGKQMQEALPKVPDGFFLDEKESVWLDDEMDIVEKFEGGKTYTFAGRLCIHPNGPLWRYYIDPDNFSLTVKDGKDVDYTFYDDWIIPEFKATADHDWGPGEITRQATETAEGEMTFKCRHYDTCKGIKTKAIPKLKPAPKPTPAKAKSTAKNLLVANGVALGKRGVNFAWSNVKADRYAIYLARCNYKGKSYTMKRVKIVNGKTFKWKKSGLKKNTAYKFYVVAQKKSGKTYKNVAKSNMGHFFTGNVRGRYTNPKSLKLSRSALTLKKGKSATIKGSVAKVRKNKALATSHAPMLRYMSNDPTVAAVNASGKVTAKKAGTAVIYVQTINGIWKTCKVTVR